MVNLRDLKKFAPAGKLAILKGIADNWAIAQQHGAINTPERITHFLAQLAHESDGFRTLREYASGAAYEGRKDLGNVRKGDGVKFRGRGPIQVTGRGNARDFTVWLRKRFPTCPDFEARPTELEKFPWAMWSAVWYWDTRKLNRYADRNDIRSITKRINGGYNGLADRRAWFRKAVAIWGEGKVDEGGKPFSQSRSVVAAGGAGLAATAATVSEVASTGGTVVQTGRDTADALGVPVLTLFLAVLVLGLIGYIIYDRWFIRKYEGV